MITIENDATVHLGEEAREAARQTAQDERAEAEKRERRKVLALNKLGDAAMLLRRDFVKKLLARKTPPKGAAILVALCLADDSYLQTNHSAHHHHGGGDAGLVRVDGVVGAADRGPVRQTSASIRGPSWNAPFFTAVPTAIVIRLYSAAK